jgi:hypothetical protein
MSITVKIAKTATATTSQPTAKTNCSQTGAKPLPVEKITNIIIVESVDKMMLIIVPIAVLREQPSIMAPNLKLLH